MLAEESPRRRVHRSQFQWRGHQPRVAEIESRSPIAIDHAILVSAYARVAARIEIVICARRRDYRDVARAATFIARLRSAGRNCQRLERRDLAEGMHAGVGAAGTVDADFL